MENITNTIIQNIVPLILAIVGSSVISTLITVFANKKIRIADVRKKEAETAEKISSAYDKVVIRLEATITCIYKKLDKLERENNEQAKKIEEVERKYIERIATLKHRVRLLARLLARIFAFSNGEITLESLINGFQVSEEDRSYLEEIVNDIEGGW